MSDSREVLCPPCGHSINIHRGFVGCCSKMDTLEPLCKCRLSPSDVALILPLAEAERERHPIIDPNQFALWGEPSP